MYFNLFGTVYRWRLLAKKDLWPALVKCSVRRQQTKRV